MSAGLCSLGHATEKVFKPNAIFLIGQVQVLPPCFGLFSSILINTIQAYRVGNRCWGSVARRLYPLASPQNVPRFWQPLTPPTLHFLQLQRLCCSFLPTFLHRKCLNENDMIKTCNLIWDCDQQCIYNSYNMSIWIDKALIMSSLEVVPSV